MLSHMSIRIWDVPYAYGPIYAYGAEQVYSKVCTCQYVARPILRGIQRSTETYAYVIGCKAHASVEQLIII